jgi:hypothetical protein
MKKISAFLAAALLFAAGTASAQLNPTTTPPTIDGNPTEWGALTGSPNTGGTNNATGATVSAYAFWIDALGDDLGDGDYTYPTNLNFSGDECDIASVRIAYDNNNLYLCLQNNPADSDIFGAYGARFFVYIDRSDLNTGSDTSVVGNHAAFCQSPDAAFFTGFNADFHWSNRGGFDSPYVYGFAGDTSDFGNPAAGVESESTATATVEASIPWSSLGGVPSGATTFRFIIGATNSDSGNARGVSETAEEFRFGGGVAGPDEGGCGNDGDVDMVDLAFAADQTTQNTDLAGGGTIASHFSVVMFSGASVSDWSNY